MMMIGITAAANIAVRPMILYQAAITLRLSAMNNIR
jgi:hypothetical protein